MLVVITASILPLLLGQATVPQAPPAPEPAPSAQSQPPTSSAQPQPPTSSAAQAEAGAAEGQSTDARRDAALARERVARLETELGAIRAQLEAERQRTAQIEQQLAVERARREEEAQAPVARDRALGTASEDLARAGQALAGGSSDVTDALVQAQALAAEVARSASATGSPQESALATDAQRLLGASQEALQRGDLFQARQALEAAMRSTGQARGLAAAGSRSAGAGYGAPGPGSAPAATPTAPVNGSGGAAAGY